MRIFFLDIDGVLNSKQSEKYWGKKKQWNPTGMTLFQAIAQEFCGYALFNLESILEEYPDVHLVITSTWRKNHSVQYLKDVFYNIGCHTISERIIDKTPQHNDDNRENEIKDWLSNTKNNVEDYLILDDEKIRYSKYLDSKHFILVNNQVGFILTTYTKVIDRLKQGVS